MFPTAFLCGLLDDNTKSKVYKKNAHTKVLAGTPAMLRINLAADEDEGANTYSLVDEGGSGVSKRRIKFFVRFSSEEKRLTFVAERYQEIH